MLENKKIAIRVLREEDELSLAKMLADKEISKTYMIPDYESFDGYIKLADKLIELSNGRNRYIRGVIVDEVLIGIINDCGIKDQTLEVGWFINPPYQKKGYCTRAVSLAFKELFELGYKVIEAAAFEGNKASMAVMERNGMTATGQSENIEYKGKNYRCICYEIKRG